MRWVEERRPDLVLLTGDLLTHPRGEPKLRELLRRLGPRTYAVLGNHDFGDARDPLAAPSRLEDLSPAHLLRDDSVELELRGRRVQLVGVDPVSYRWGARTPTAARTTTLISASCSATTRTFHRLRTDSYHVVLAGHLHDGQIAIPYGRGKVRLAHGSWRYTKGLYRRGDSTLHVSPGLGTTFVPFRFFARPEATELVLRPA